MTLGRPDLLWLLLAGVPVILVHLVRRRRRRVPVPSLLLWDEVVARASRVSGLRALAGLLSLLLVLLAIGAATLAAADPRTGEPAPPPRPLLLLVSNAARMEGGRWDRAVAVAGEEIARKAPADPVTVLLVSEAPRIVARGETDGSRILLALAAARPVLAREAWALAAPAAEEALAGGARVVAVGVAPEAPEGTAVRSVPGGNAGITAFGVRVGVEIEVWLRAAGDLAGREVVVALDDREVARVPAAREVSLAVERGDGGVLRARIEPPEGPAFDDEVAAVVPATVRLRVGVVAGGGPDPFLAAALRILAPMLDADGSGVVPPDRVADVEGAFDVLVWAGGEPSAPPPADALLLGPPPAVLGFLPAAPVASAPVWERSSGHPVTRDVDTAEVVALGAAPARVPEGAVALLSVPGGAVAAAGEAGGRRFVWIGLGPEDSTLPVSGAFPLLVRNALRWFADLRSAPLPPAVTLDEEILPRMAPRPGAGREELVEVRLGTQTFRVARNALFPGETEAAPVPDSGPPPADRSVLRDTERRLWPWLVAAAALLLLLESAVGRVGNP